MSGLARFSPNHQRDIQRLRDGANINQAEAIDRFLVQQKCLNALSLRRVTPSLTYEEALQKIENIRFYGSEFPR